MNITPMITYLLDDVGISKAKVAEMLKIDPKTVTAIHDSREGYTVVKASHVT